MRWRYLTLEDAERIGRAVEGVDGTLEDAEDLLNCLERSRARLASPEHAEEPG